MARLGGEEFVLLLPETQLDDACVCAERLRGIISRYVLALADTDVTFTVSIGVSEACATSSIATLFKEADIALYEAKRGGRNQVRAFMPRGGPPRVLEAAS